MADIALSLLVILPLLLCLILALWLRRTLIALGVGIIFAALIITHFDVIQTSGS